MYHHSGGLTNGGSGAGSTGVSTTGSATGSTGVSTTGVSVGFCFELFFIRSFSPDFILFQNSMFFASASESSLAVDLNDHERALQSEIGEASHFVNNSSKELTVISCKDSPLAPLGGVLFHHVYFRCNAPLLSTLAVYLFQLI